MKISRGMRRILEALEENSELRYTQLKEKARKPKEKSLSDPSLCEFLRKLRHSGLVKKTPTGQYRVTPKGRLVMTQIHDNDLVAYKDVLLRSTIEPRFADSLPRDIRAPIDKQLEAFTHREVGDELDPLFEYMPPPGPVGVTLYGSKQLRQSLNLPLNGTSEVSESKASLLLSEPWNLFGKYVRQLVFWLLIDYFMVSVDLNRSPDLSLQLGMIIRLDMQDSPDVRHRIAGMLFWYMGLPHDDPATPRFSLPKLLTLMETKLGMITNDESQLLHKLIEGKEKAEFEKKCLELAIKHFAEGGCL